MNRRNSSPIVKILVKRDKITYAEAVAKVLEAQEELMAGNENAIAEILQLEDDFLADVLFF